MKWFVKGDIDGFFGLALDNLVQVLLISSLCQYVLDFPADLVYGRILPGVAVSLVVGNLFYARQALQLAKRTGRTDVCALPYGINTLSLFAYVFLVMLPVKLSEEAAGNPDAAGAAWRAGLVAALGSGLIEIGGAFVAERIRRVTPRAALLSTLAGIAITFISLGFLFQTAARPLVGLSTLGIVLVVYFGRVRIKGGLPGGLVAVVVGTGIAWATGLAPGAPIDDATIGWHPPIPVIGDLWQATQDGYFLTYLSVILPMGIFNVVGSLQNIESAEAAGDSYPTAPSLAMNGLGTLIAAGLGSCFPTTIYIGHPGWKGMGARAGYSVLNAAFFVVICFSGTLAYIVYAVPVDAAMAIVLWIGIVITAQAFQATPRAHAPAVVIGLMPGIAAWGAYLAKSGIHAAGMGGPGQPPLTEALVSAFRQQGVFIDGAFALEQGFIFSAMVLAAATTCVIERQFIRASIWAGVGAVLSGLGLMHSYKWTPSDTVLNLEPLWENPEHWRFPAAYGLMALVFLLANWLTEPERAVGA